MKSFLLFLIFFNTSSLLLAQKLQWVKTVAGRDFDAIEKIVVDKSNNVYSIGNFGGTSEVGTNKGDGYKIKSRGRYDSFVMKQSQDGEVLWIRSCGSKDYDYGTSISLDSKGNCYLVGAYYNDTLKFSNSDLKFQCKGNYDGYIVKYDPDGNLVYAKTISSQGYQYIEAIELDKYDNIYIHGTYNGTFDMDFGNAVDEIEPNQKLSLFLIKYSPDFEKVIFNSVTTSMNGSVGLTEARMAVSPEGFVYIGGSYTSDLLQSLNNQTDSTFSNGRVDGFVCGISPNGKISFINTIGGPQNDYVNSLHTSDDSHFFVGGNYSDTCYFDKSNLKKFSLPIGGSDAYCADYSNNGKFNIFFNFGGKGEDNLHSVFMFDQGIPCMIGEFRDSIDFPNYMLKSQGKSDVIVYFPIHFYINPYILSIGGELTNEGNYVYVKQNGQSLDVIIAGQFYGKMFFDSSRNIMIPSVNEFTVSVEQNKNNFSFSYYNNIINLNFKESTSFNLEIFNTIGELITFQKYNNESHLFFPTKHLKSGVYFLKIRNLETNETIIKKFVIS
jgi:hypothetical protein